MDQNLYDEFGNYIGPEIEEEEEDEYMDVDQQRSPIQSRSPMDRSPSEQDKFALQIREATGNKFIKLCNISASNTRYCFHVIIIVRTKSTFLIM